MMQVEKIKVPKTIREPYSDVEREKLFRSATNIRDKAIIEFLYSTAVRVCELVKLDIKDINWSTKDLIVYRKGDKERNLPAMHLRKLRCCTRQLIKKLLSIIIKIFKCIRSE